MQRKRDQTSYWSICFVGTCSTISNRSFLCHCKVGWGDDRCQTMINYCQRGACFHNGVCQPLYLNYTCRCLDGSYYGGHCEIVTDQLRIRQIISKSFAYIEIIAIASVFMFVMILDFLKYCLGIDPAARSRKGRQLRKAKKAKRKTKPVIIQYIYVNKLPQDSLTESTVWYCFIALLSCSYSFLQLMILYQK